MRRNLASLGVPIIKLTFNLTVGLTVTMACSSSSNPATAGPTADQACTDVIGTLCDSVNACSPTLIQLAYGDTAACKSRLVIGCASGLSANGSSSIPSKLEQCAQDLKSVQCSDLLNGVLPASCTPDPGKLADGAACGDSAQCNSAFCAKDATKSLCGVCARKPAVGTACKKDDDCGGFGSGLHCAGGASSTCRRPAAKDADCSSDNPCGSGLSCLTGRCVAAAKAGETCDPESKKAPNCDFAQGVFCAPGSLKCQKIKVGRPSEACGFIGGDFIICPAAGDCTGVTVDKPSGACTVALKDGDACGASGPGCSDPAKCVAGRCQIPDPASCH